MKTLRPLAIILIGALGCRPEHTQDKRTQMVLDSTASGKNVTIVRPKETVRPDESITDLKELSTIMQSDIDAMQRTRSKEVVYVKPGEAVRPSEKR